jgi:hypothetical protein
LHGKHNSLDLALFPRVTGFFGMRLALATEIKAPRLWEDFVKTRLHSLSSLATLAVLLGLISWGGSLHAQQPGSAPDASQTPSNTQTPSQAPDQATPPASDKTAPSQAAPTQTPSDSQPQASQDQASGQAFSGTIVKQGDKYVLQDAATGTTYDIDHQDEVKKFDGKKVRVHGTLDPTGKMIHVQ